MLVTLGLSILICNPIPRVSRILERYLSFDGRLVRLPFFIRGVWVGIAAGLIFLRSLPLFSSGGLLWWIGLAVVFASLATLATGTASLIVRRLHDINFSGYHALWVLPTQLVPTVGFQIWRYLIYCLASLAFGCCSGLAAKNQIALVKCQNETEIEKGGQWPPFVVVDGRDKPGHDDQKLTNTPSCFRTYRI